MILENSLAMEIPYTELSKDALRGIIEEYITREGTDYGTMEYSLDQKIDQVRVQLERGEVRINFDSESQSCNLFAAGNEPPAVSGET